MGLETRGVGKNIYYYGKKRDGKKVSSIYVGKGLMAEVFADTDKTYQLDKALKKLQAQQQKQQEQLTYDAYTKPLTQLIKQNQQLLKACYLIAGFHNHKCCWQRKRGKAKENDNHNELAK